jgi:hypothetical protein
MSSRLLRAGILLLLLSGCREDQHFLLKVVFPGPEAKQQTRSLVIAAVLPAEDSSCAALMAGSARPGDSGYPVEDRVEFGYPAEEGIPPLKKIGSGLRLFWAEAVDSGGEVFLHGCREADVGSWAAQIVTIVLELVCQPEGPEGPAGDASCGDSRDNDCDGDTDTDDPGCHWWDFDFHSRIKLSFENGAGAEDLIDFPVRVSLHPGRIDYSRTRAVGEDLRFVDADGLTPLPHQIEIWDENATSEVWVRVPQIDAGSDTDFVWMYFENPQAEDGQDPTAVWAPGHAGVWHLAAADDGAGTIPDSSATGNHGTAVGGAVFETAATIGRGVLFDGVDDYIVLGNAGFNPSEGTVEVFMRLEALPASNRGYAFAHCTTDTATGNRAYLYIQDNGTFSTGMGDQVTLDSGSVLGVGNWYYLAISWDGTEVTGYLDGAVDFGPTAYAALAAVGRIYSMSWDSSIQFLNGTLDELRLSAVHRTAGWFAAQNRSLNDALVTFGAMESAP